ncbi:MAG: DHHW family protein [Clostridium sp.]
MIRYMKCAILSVLFIFIIVSLGAYDGFKGDKLYSQIENRRLKKSPKITLDGVLNGDFFREYEEYRQDQYGLKDMVVGSYIKFNLYTLGKDKVNGFYLAKDGRLFEDKDIDQEVALANIRKRNEYIRKVNKDIKKMGKEFYVMYAPESSDYNMEPLPEYSKYNMKVLKKLEDEIDSVGADVDYINARRLFLDDKTGDKYYYKTDNHWNIDGAFKAYEYIVNKSRGVYPMVPKILMPYDGFMVDTYYDFYGSYNRQLQFNVDSYEEFRVYIPSRDLVTGRDSGGKPGKKIIQKDLIDTNYSYSAFMGGDMARDIIKTSRSNLPNILVIGNSFTNSLETLLFANFNEMHSMDVRQENMGEVDIGNYVNRNDIDIVVYVHGGI